MSQKSSVPKTPQNVPKALTSDSLNIRPFLAEDIPGGKKGAGLLRAKPNIKWEKDRGKEPQRDKAEFPWFWGWDGELQDFAGGRDFDGNRWNDCHYSNEFRKRAREANKMSTLAEQLVSTT